MKNQYGVKFSDLVPGERATIALDRPMFQEVVTIDSATKERIVVRSAIGQRARVGFDQITAVIANRAAEGKAA